MNDIVRQESNPFPTDTSGFEHCMGDLVSTLANSNMITEDQAFAYVGQISSFMTRVRGLEQKNLNYERTKSFKPGEACLLHDGGACIVIAAHNTTCTMQAWWNPCRTTDGSGLVKILAPHRIRKVYREADWAEWKKVLSYNGHSEWPRMVQWRAMQVASWTVIDNVLGGVER